MQAIRLRKRRWTEGQECKRNGENKRTSGEANIKRMREKYTQHWHEKKGKKQKERDDQVEVRKEDKKAKREESQAAMMRRDAKMEEGMDECMNEGGKRGKKE